MGSRCGAGHARDLTRLLTRPVTDLDGELRQFASARRDVSATIYERNYDDDYDATTMRSDSMRLLETGSDDLTRLRQDLSDDHQIRALRQLNQLRCDLYSMSP